jgi:hypothetical protein
MNTAAVILGTLALIAPESVRAQPLEVHMMNSVAVNLTDDLPIRLPVKLDVSRSYKKYHQDVSCCYDGQVELYALEPFSILLHRHWQQSFITSRFDNCWPSGFENWWP